MMELTRQVTSTSKLRGIPRNIVLGLLRGFQLCISPIYRPCCRFYPTCSEYAVESIKRFGLIRGVWLTITRIGRCNPLAHSGVDLVPEEFEVFPWRKRQLHTTTTEKREHS